MNLYTPGKTYRELKVGEFATHSKTISESDVYNFAGITGDFNPLHVDRVFAQKIGLKSRIAHAGLAPAMIAKVIGMKLPGVGSIVSKLSIELHQPIYIDDTIFVKVTMVEKLPERKVKLLFKIINQGGELVCSGIVYVLPPKPRFKKMVENMILELEI
ncbi:3-hydroxybutyryl-CoA dehydratase [Moritella sp. JT01]|uniref:MaoC family dehydratase n=1 Tax=Moritella sp. JT01 TaxID=756698 RepID=UPI0007944E8E|nr:MaoC family dehydratase [Moritella sp. JT01]KXO12886.1 3-hydroxybutyryl-CoA dehydratase [Moritella sp. JT01]